MTRHCIVAVVDLVVLTFQCLEHLNSSEYQYYFLDELVAAQTFITFATTITSSLLISYRIYTLGGYTENIPKKTNSRRLCKQVVEVLLQSSAAYSLVALVDGILLVLPSDSYSLIATQSYTDHLFVFISVSGLYNDCLRLRAHSSLNRALLRQSWLHGLLALSSRSMIRQQATTVFPVFNFVRNLLRREGRV